VVLLTEEGRRVMTGQIVPRLMLPSSGSKRTNAASPAPRAKRSPAREPEALDAAGLSLFERLREHRLEVSKQLGVPPYVVASDRTLRELAALRPRNLDELLRAHGVGRVKAERFGEGLLEVVRRENATGP
jgi:ATP-dependent DNA helicase RecQ